MLLGLWGFGNTVLTDGYVFHHVVASNIRGDAPPKVTSLTNIVAYVADLKLTDTI